MKNQSLRLLTVGALFTQALLGAAIPAEPPAAASQTLTLKVEPERDLLYRKGPHEVIVQVEIDGQRRPGDAKRSPMNLSVSLDRSGSMEGAKIEKARQAAAMLVDRLDPDDTFSLVIYDDQTELLIPPQRVGSRRNREEIKERIEQIRPGGSTALYAGVSLSAAQVRKFQKDDRVNRVILLSDGIANVGPSTTSELSRLGRDLRENGISVSTIGVGDDYNEDLMTALAESSHGNYYYVRDAEKLPQIFAEELGATAAKLASEVIIRIEAPKGVRLREIIGYPEIRCEGPTAEIRLPEFFAEHRLFHVRCEIDEMEGESAPLANVTLHYQDAVSKQAATQNQTATIRFTEDVTKAEGSVRNEIARSIGVLQNRLAKEKAVRLADEGRAKDAAAVLSSQAAANAAAPVSQQIPDVQEENKKLGKIASELKSRGALGVATRKQAQWENYQDKYQKR